MDIPDYKQVAYRTFIFVHHEKYGLLLLYCTRKRKKGSYYQLPGGHLDENDFEKAGTF
jgi:8-oxo-dGTP pyrophosphatase MutT (NUDIX family)